VKTSVGIVHINNTVHRQPYKKVPAPNYGHPLTISRYTEETT